MALTEEQRAHFLAHGWVKLEQCFSRESAAQLTGNVWTRLGMDPNDKSTWSQERINMPGHRSFPVAEYAPKAWDGMCDLLGGADRIEPAQWRDALIVNLGTPEGEGKHLSGNELQGWHVDGDFFVHYLDSPEQGLLVIPLFTDVVPGGGGTMICPGAIPHVAKHLYEHPEGVGPRMTPRAENPTFEPEPGLEWFNELASSFPPDAFVEATGTIGDVYLLHPLMLHSASTNPLRKVRIITNPPVAIKEPFEFDRKDGKYSVVEQHTLKALGKDNLAGWKIQDKRETVIPERVRIQERLKREELERLEKARSIGVAVKELDEADEGWEKTQPVK
jgi:hypothetical protein